MSDPTRLPEEEQAKAALHAETEEINRLERLLAQHSQGAQPIAEIDKPAARERLFSRKTLFGWAFATLIVVFVVRMILPRAFESARDSAMDRTHEPSVNTAAPVVIPAPTTTTTTTRIVIKAPEVPEPPVVKVEVKKR